MARSRLSERIERKTRKNLTLSILGIILVVLVAFKFGIPLLINLSLFLSGLESNQEQSKIQDSSFVAPPILNSFPQATTSANIVISGMAIKNQTINLYINGNLIDKINTKDDGSFSFNETILSGENAIKTKATVDNKESDFSNTLTITFKSAPPSLNISSPTGGQSFSKDQNTVSVKGTTDVDAKVTVNGFWAIMDGSGNFFYNFPLQNGENKINVEATDIAGNKTAKEIRVTYSP